MMIDRAAVQQALDALQHAEKDAADFQRINYDQTSAAITALRKVIEAPQQVQQEPAAWVWNPFSEAWERVHVYGLWQPGAVYAFGPTPPAGPQTEQHEAHRLAYPGGGAALFDKLWHLTFNCVTSHAGNHVKTDLLPMQEMREFLQHLCCIVDSPPAQQPDGMRIAAVELENPMPTFDEVFDKIDWDVWRMKPIRELVRMIHGKTSSRQEQDALRIVELEAEVERFRAHAMNEKAACQTLESEAKPSLNCTAGV